MRPEEKRKFEADRLIKDYLSKAKKDFGEKNVKSETTSDGKVIITISNDVSTVSRKEHTHPEYMRKDGD